MYFPHMGCVRTLRTLYVYDTRLEVASFNACRNNYRGPNFLDTPLAQTPANFGPKNCFW